MTWPRVFLHPTLGAGILYDLRDEFMDTRAAGSVDGTPATPGPGTRTVVDTDGDALSIGGGVLSLANPNSVNGDPGIWYDAVTREAGRLFLIKFVNPTWTSKYFTLGFDINQSGGIQSNEATWYLDSGVLEAYVGLLPAILTPSNGVDLTLAIVLRTNGAYWFYREGVGDWIFAYTSDVGNTATLYPGFANYNFIGDIDFMRDLPPTRSVLPTPLAYDTFTRSDGALGSTETTGPDSQAVTARTWNNRIGTTQISSNAASASALSGGLAIATVDCGKLDVLHGAELTRSAGNVGIVVRYADDQNYVIAYHDGTNAKLDKVVGGSATNVISAAATYSAGAKMWITVEDTSFSLYYNNAKIGSTSTISDAALQTGTEVGLYSTDTGNSQDDMETWARGTGGEYSALSRY